MSITVFPAPVNDLAMTLLSGRSAGANTLSLSTGSGAKILAALAELGYGPPSAPKPLRVTVTKAAYTGRGDISVIQATGLLIDTLIGCTVVEGTPDQDFLAGDIVEVEPTAGMVKTIGDAINAVETGLDSLTTTVAGKATDAAIVHLAGVETITGVKVFSALPTLAGLTGILAASTGVIGVAVAGTDYLTPTGNGSGLTNLNGSAVATGTVAAARLPAFGASGGSHAAGILPDPGAVAGTTKAFFEDGTWKVPASGGTPGGSSGQLEYNNAGAFGGTAAGTYATSGFLFTFQAQATTDVPLVCKGMTGQSGSLQEWQDVNAVVKAKIDINGFFTALYVNATGANGFALGVSGNQGIWSNSVFQFPSATVMYWASTNVSSGAKDVGIERQTTNCLKVHDGTAGQAITSNLGFLKGKLVIRTGAGAPTGSPTFDGELYWDTTNFKLSAGSGGAWKTLATAFT